MADRGSKERAQVRNSLSPSPREGGNEREERMLLDAVGVGGVRGGYGLGGNWHCGRLLCHRSSIGEMPRTGHGRSSGSAWNPGRDPERQI